MASSFEEVIFALSSGFKDLAAAIGLSTAALGSFLLVPAAIGLTIGIYDLLTESIGEAQEKSADAREEYQNTVSELESINSELETTSSRINELKSKGALTLTEQDELSRLQAQNAELERRKTIQEQIAQTKAKESANAATNVLTKEKNYTTGEIAGMTASSKTGTIIDETYAKQEKLNEVTEKYNALQEEQYALAESGVDLTSAWWEADTQYEKNAKQLASYQKQMDSLKSSITENVSEINTEYQSLLDTNGNVIPGFETLAKSCEELFNKVLSSSDKAASAQEKIDSILSRPTLSNAKNNLIEMAKASDDAGISADDISKKYPELAKAAEDAGVKVEDLADTINSMAGVVNIDEIKNQLSKAFSGSSDEWSDFVSSMSNEEIKILYGIYSSQDTSAWSIDDWNLALEESQGIADKSSKSYEELKSQVDSVSGSMKTFQSAMSNSVSGSGISVDEFSKINDMFSGLEGYDASKLFETTANGIRINTEAARELTAQYEAQTKLDLANKLSELGSQYDDLTEQLKNCTEGSEEYNQILSQRDAIESEIQNVSLLASEYDGLMSKYQKWIDAQSSADEGNMYDNVTSNLKKMKDLYEKGLVGTDDFRAGVDFMTYQDMSNASVDELVEAYKKANKTMNTYFTDGQKGCVRFLEDVHKINSEWASMNEDGSWEINFNDEEVAKSLGTSVEAVQAILRKLNDYGFEINLDSPTKSIQTLKEKIEETESALKDMGETPIEIDINADDINSEIDNAKSKIQEINESEVSAEVKTAQLEDANAKLDALIQKKHEAENPAFMSVDVNQVNASLTEAVGYLKEYQTAVNNLDTLEIKGADSSEIESAKKKVDELAGKIQGLDKDTKVTIGLEADGSIDSIKKQIASGDVVVDVSGDTTKAKTEIDNINGTDVSVNVTTSGNEALDALKSGLESLTDKTVTVTAKVVGNDEINNIKKSQDAFLDKKVTTETEVKGEKEVKSLTESIKNLTGKVVKVIANVIGKNNVDNLRTSINNVRSKTVYINSISKSSVAKYNGTAHVNGTAYASGDWSVKRTETALGAEVGKELVVRNGKFFTLDYPQLFQARKGDIIFDANQTEQLLSKGKITSGKKFGKSYAQGTAYSGGSGSFYNSGKKVTSSSKTKSSSKSSSKSKSSSSKSSSSSSNDFKETFDWIEIAVNRVETAIKNLKLTAESAFKTFTNRNNALNKEIKQVTGEINLQQKAYSKYMQQANAVGLSSDWKQKVQNGSISLSTVKNKDLAEKIKKYQELYEKAQSCLTTISELKETEAELYNQKLELIQSDYSNKIDYYETMIGNIESSISFAESRGGYGTASQYSSMESYTRSEIKNLKAERSALQAQLDSAVSKGIIQKYSEQWYEWQNQINSLNGEIYSASEKLAEYAEKIANIPLDKLNAKLEKINSIVEVLDAKYEAAQSASSKNKILADQNAQAKKELDAYNAAAKETQNYVNSLWNSSALKAARNTSANSGKEKGSKLSLTGLSEDSDAYQAVLNYNAALDAQEESLNEAEKASYEYTVALRENAKQMFDNIREEYESKQSPVNALISYYNQVLSYRDSMGYSQTSDSQKGVYNKILSNTKSLLESQEKELADLQNNYNKNKASMSEADAREAEAEIYALQESILETKASIAELQTELNNIEVKKLEITLDKLKTKANELEDAISLKEAKGLSATADDYVALINNTQKQIDNLKKQNELLKEQQSQYESNSEKYEELRQQIEENEDAIREAEKAQIEWNNAIADIPISKLEKALELVQAISDNEESLLDLKIASGEVVTEEDYQKQIQAQNDKLAQLQEERELIYGYYQKALESEDGTYAGKTADEWKKEYTELDTEINKVKIDIIELQDNIDNIDLKKLSNQLDDLEREANKLDSAISLKETTGQKLTKSDYKELISNSEKQVSNLEKQNRLLKEQLSEVEEGSDKYYEIQNQIQDNEEAIARCKEEQAKWNVELENLPIERLEEALDLLDSIDEKTKSEIELKTAQGKDLTEADYKKQISNNNNQINNLQKKRSEATSNYQKALASDDGVYGGKTADEWKAVINETDTAINNLKIENEELKDSLRDDVYWRNFERMHDEVERTSDVLAGISDLIDDDMLFDSEGNLTQYGVDKIALLTKQYELARKEVRNYTNDIKNLNKLYAEGQYTEEEYKEKLAELQSGLLDAASDMKDYQDAIIDMYKSMEQAELDTLFEVIDARNEALRKKKEYYDFDKTIRGKTKDIQELQAQLAALEGISGAEAAAKRAKLQAELSDAQEDLNDTLKEHEFEIAQESLDAMKDTLQDAFDDRWDNIASDMDEVQKLMNDANQIVESSTAQINTSLNDLLNYYGINASATEIDTVSGVGYNNGYSGGNSNTSIGSSNTNNNGSSGINSGIANDISNAFSNIFGNTENNIDTIKSILEQLYSGTDLKLNDIQNDFYGFNSDINYSMETIRTVLEQIQSITPDLIEENIAATKDFYSQLVDTGRELYSQLSDMSNNLSNETHFDVDFNIDKMGTTSTQELTKMYDEFYKYVDKKLSEELRKYGIKKKV